MSTVVHVKAPNTPSGNPQRLYLVLDGPTVLGAVDEGYVGDRALAEYVGGAGLMRSISCTVNVTATEYKRFLKDHGPKSNRFRLRTKK